MLYAISFPLLLIFIMRTDAEPYTSPAFLEDLLKTEQRAIENLESYIRKEDHRLSILKGYLHNFKREHVKAMDNITDYVSIPINAFTLLKRLTVDLSHFNNSVKKSKVNALNYVNIKHNVNSPAKGDLASAARAFALIQETKNLDAKELSEGKLNSVAYSSPMTAGECYELGKELHDKGDYMNARPWMFQAWQKYDEEGVVYPSTDISNLEYFNDTCYLLGDSKMPLNGLEVFRYRS